MTKKIKAAELDKLGFISHRFAPFLWNDVVAFEDFETQNKIFLSLLPHNILKKRKK